jgi:prepilin-type N-terminal cleavage/methylation domain-containing protein
MKRESGFRLIELLVVIMVIAIIASMAVVGLLRARGAANESSAIGTLRTIGSGQLAYSSSCGRGYFATDLTTLGTPSPGSNDAFVSPDLTGANVVQKSGYEFEMAEGADATDGVQDCNGTDTKTAFYLSAEPLSFGTTGNRAFAINSAGNNTIWSLEGGTAPSEPFGSPARPIQ